MAQSRNAFALPAGGAGRRLLLEAIATIAVAGAVALVGFHLDAFAWLHGQHRAFLEWHLDEILVLFTVSSAALLVFGARRICDQRRELALRKAAEQHARILALQDVLTGLPNRRRFLEALAALPAAASHQHALMVLDLDGFKPVNDMFGHASGDAALKTVAHRLKSVGDERMLAARLGGDEFAILVRNLLGREEAERIAARIVSAVEIPIVAGGVDHQLGISIGIAFIGGEATASEEPMRRADVALYRAKEQPGSAYVFYDETMDVALRERIRLERELKRALAEDRIVPHYQPIVDLKTGDILKLEALARWHDPTLGEVPPDRFIPLAEERGLIAEVTDRIMRRACRDAAGWPASIVLAVNLSPALLDSNAFPLRLVKILADTGLPPHRLELEITERALKAETDQVRSFLQNLRDIGVRIALDDFGTGYSSLSRLRELQFDEIKIDGSFIQSLAANEDSGIIVRAVIELGRGLGIAITAEGIEEAGQRDTLIADGCRHGQGFLFSKAMPAKEVDALFHQTKRAAAE